MADFPEFIELDSLDGTNGFRLDGIDTLDFSGTSVASAGDVNGDGFDDIIIGAPSNNAGGGNGESYVVFGMATGFAASVDLSTLDGTDGFRLDGVSLNDQNGSSVSSAGDVNGDGIDDIIIGAPLADPGGDEQAGQSYVVFGMTTGFSASLDLSTLDGANGFRLDGIDPSDRSGDYVSFAGDINGDGIDDIIVGAPAFFAAGAAGESYVVFGRNTGFAASIALSSLTGTDGFRIDGINAGDSSGSSVASAGDVNGDDIDDIIVGAANADPGGVNLAGESYVVFGRTTGFSASLDLSTLDGANGFRLEGIDPDDRSGASVSSAGDVNGDGIDDIIVGAPLADPGGDSQAGESYVVFGRNTGFGASFDLATLDGTNGFQIDGIDMDDASGLSVSSAGDVNGDGFDDIIIGSRLADPGGDSAAGESYVVFGKAGGFTTSLSLSSLDGNNGFRLDGIDPDDRSGRSVSSAGDVNGDGFGDIIIGANLADPGGDDAAGESYVVFGRAPIEAAVRFGDDGDQTILGGAFADTLSGMGGDDELIGGGGADRLMGDFDIPTQLLNAGTNTEDFAQTANYAMPTGALTIEMLYRLDGPVDNNVTDHILFSYRTSGGAEFRLRAEIGTVLVLDANGTSINLGIEFNTIFDGSPHRISLTYDPAGDQVEVFIDGTLESSISVSITPIAANGTLIFGQTQGIAGGGFIPSQILRGDIADIRIWDDLRTAQEIADNAFTEIANPMAEQGLVNNWRPDGSMFTIPDAVGGVPLGLFGTPVPSSFGGSGNDVLEGGSGADVLDGGLGSDTASYRAANGGLTVDLQFSGANTGDAAGDTFLSVENLSGSSGADLLRGDAGANVLSGLGGDDILIGRAGDDTLDGGAGEDTADYATSTGAVSVNLIAGVAIGGAAVGSDTLIDIENLEGGTVGDTVFGSDVRNILRGYGGDDTLAGRAGNDQIRGGDGDDALSGGDGADFMFGDDGDDRIFGNNGTDTIFGGLGDDLINGGAGNDVIDSGSDSDNAVVGGGGDDTIRGRSGNDGLNGSSGNDWLRGDSGDDRLFGGMGDDLLEGGANDDTLSGQCEADTLLGGAGDDGLSGGAGDDIMDGEDGADRLFGGTGADRLTGGSGNDLLVGQGGLDTFVFEANWGQDDIARYGEITSTGPRVDEVIDMSALGIDFSDLTIIQNGNETVINVTGNSANTITLTFVNAATITADDFLF